MDLTKAESEVEEALVKGASVAVVCGCLCSNELDRRI
jgi:hypothetical protein